MPKIGFILRNWRIIYKFYLLNRYLDRLLKDYNGRGTHLQNYLYFVYIPVFNYTKAIMILCSCGKYNAASALLRSLFEAHINVIYHQVEDSEKRLAISARSRFIQLKKSFTGVNKLIEKFPNLKSSEKGDLFNEEYLEEAIKKVDSKIKIISVGNYLNDKDNELEIYKKAEKCDDVSLPNSQGGHFQRMYNVIYRQLSSSVHLDVLGLESFVDKDKGGRYFSREEYNGMILLEAIKICIALTKDLYENGVLNGKTPGVVFEIERLANVKIQ